MKNFSFLPQLSVLALVSLISFSSAAAQVQSYNHYLDKRLFEERAGASLTTITFEGFTVNDGNDNAYILKEGGGEYSHLGVTFQRGDNAQELTIGRPNPAVSTDPWKNFFAPYFFPTSGRAVLTADNYKAYANQSPRGSVIVKFAAPVRAVGGNFLDVDLFDGWGSMIAAYDGAGNLVALNRVPAGAPGQAQFAGVITPQPVITKVIIRLGIVQGWEDGVALDDLVFARD